MTNIVTASTGTTGITGVASQPAGGSRVVVTLSRGGLLVVRDGVTVDFSTPAPSTAQVPVLVNGSYVFVNVSSGGTAVPPRTPCSPWPAGWPSNISDILASGASAPWWTGSNASSAASDVVTLVYPDVTLTYAIKTDTVTVSWTLGECDVRHASTHAACLPA